MKKSFAIFLGIIFLTNLTCKPKKLISQNMNEPVKELIIDKNYRFTEDSSLSIVSAKIKGDTLSMILNYHGGMGIREYNLYFNGIYMKSMPPQVNLFLKYTLAPEKYDKLKSDTLNVDIGGLKFGEHGTLIIRLQGFNERLEYNF